MGKSGERKKTLSFRNLFRLCKGKGNADDDRHAYQKQPLHNQSRRSDERRDTASIEEHYNLKEYRKPHDIESKRDVKNDKSNSGNTSHGVSENNAESDATKVTKVHVEPLNRNGAIKAYMIDTLDTRVDSPKEVPDDKVDCANSFENIPFIDADDENGDKFQAISIAEIEIKEKNENQGQEVVVHEIPGGTVIGKVPTTNEVRNQETFNSDNELVAFIDTKAKIDDLKTYRETEEIVSIEQTESPLNTQDAIDSSEENPSSQKEEDNDALGINLEDWHVVSDEISTEPSDFIKQINKVTCNENDHDENIVPVKNLAYYESFVGNVDDFAADRDQSLNKGSNLETSSQIDNEKTDDKHVPDSHDIDSKPHLTTYSLNEGSKVETIWQAENVNLDDKANVLGTHDVVSKPDNVTDADTDKKSGNEQEEGRNTNNDDILGNTKHDMYNNSFDDDDDNQHIYNDKNEQVESSKDVISTLTDHDDDDDSDFESGQDQFQDTLNWYDTGGATGGHSLSKVFKANQNETTQNYEEVTWNKQLHLSEPTDSVGRVDDEGKTTPKEDLPEKALPDKSDNVLFYQNKIKSRPPIGHTIEDMLKWMGDYAFLEKNHSYIQWLFPIPGSSGMNYQAQALQDHEIEIMKNDEDIQGRVIRSFRMMLDFYGMEMIDDTFQRNERNWQARYNHLNQSFHNRMRITRIIQSLGELGFTKIQTRWLSFLMQEAMVNKSLNRLGGDSMQYFIDAIKEDDDRHKLYEKYFRYMMGDFSEANDNVDDANDSNVKHENGENVEDKSDGNSQQKSDKNFDGKSNENVDAKNCENDEDKRDENGNVDVSNGCDSGKTDEVNTNVTQDMSDDYKKIEKGSTGSIALSDNADNEFSDNYSTAEEDTDHELNVDHNITETIDHVYKSMENVEYREGSNYTQNNVSLAPDATSDTSGDTIRTDLGNSQSYNTDAGTTETKKSDKAQEEQKGAIDGEHFEIQSIGSNDDDTDIKTSYMKDDTKDKETDPESNDKTVDTITRNDSVKDNDDSVYETKNEDADVDSNTEPDDSNEYIVFHSTDGTIKH